MRQLHIRAQSGPRPVTAAAVRALLADGSLDPSGPVLSLDGGRTWQPVTAALAVIDGFAVDDHAVDRALRVGPLHPIAMPVGALAIALLAAGIAFGGGPAAPAIRQLPTCATAHAAAVIDGGNALLHGGIAVAGQWLGRSAGFLHAGMNGPAPPAEAPAPEPLAPPPAAEPVPAPQPAATAPASGDLFADWRQLLSDRASSETAWSAAADALGKRTIATGVAGWNAHMSILEVLTDANRSRFTVDFTTPGAAKRLAMFDLGVEAEPLEMLLLVHDENLAKTCDVLAAETRPLRIDATITAIKPAPAKRSVLMLGTLTAAE